MHLLARTGKASLVLQTGGPGRASDRSYGALCVMTSVARAPGTGAPDRLREPVRGHLLLVVRGGANSLSDSVLERSVGDCWEQYTFFGVSVFGAPGDDLVVLS